MNEKDSAFFGSLLNVKPEDVEQSVNDGTLGEKVAALNLMTSQQVETLKANLAKQVKETHITELVDGVSKGETDKTLYDAIKKSALSKIERKLADKYKIEKFEGFDDLVTQAISNNKGLTDDTRLQELETKISDLQGINKNLVKEKDSAVIEANTKADERVLMRDKRDMVNSIPFDFSDVEETRLKEVSGQRRQIAESVFDSKYSLAFEGEKVVAKDKQGNVVKDPATLESIPPAELMYKIPVELGIKIKGPETGGQGGSSSGDKSGTRFSTLEEFGAHCEKNGILPTSAAGVKLFMERGPQ